jgi:hypothetical protein
MTQVLKLGAQVIGRVCVGVVTTEQFVDQAGDAQVRANVGGVGVVLNDANGQPGLANWHVGLLPCERVVNLGEEYGLNCHLPVLVSDLQLVVDTIPAHGVEQVVVIVVTIRYGWTKVIER